MKKLLLLLPLAVMILAFCSGRKEADASGAEKMQFFKGSWSQAVAKAKKDNKAIFLDIYATWCGPCKMLKRETFVDKAVAKFYNANFINVTLDGETGDGLMLAERFRISGFPTLIILDQNEKPVYGTAGFLPAPDFIKFGKEGLARVNK